MNRCPPSVSIALLLAMSGLAQGADDASAPAAASGGDKVYNFQALLDDKPMGTHRFAVGGSAEAHTVDSEANFEVRFLGIKAFHYHHQANEQWKGNCLQSLKSSTDDDGKPASVDSHLEGGEYKIKTATGEATAPACTMSYAYWNPAMREQTHLLNPQTGKVDAVRIERVGSGKVTVHGAAVEATQYRINGPEAPVDVWYSAQGDWVGLDSVVGGKHKLSYRLP